MKLIISLVLTFILSPLAEAQEFVTQNFGPSSTPGNYTSTVPLANAGPLIFILGTEFNYGSDESNQPPTSADITVTIDGGTPFAIPGKDLVVTQHPTDPNNGQVYATAISSLTYTTAVLQPGNHTVKVTFNSGWDVSGTSTQGGYTIIAPNEIASGVQSAINTLTTEIQSNSNAITAFQAQLTGVQTTLQNEIDAANGNIAGLQTGEQTDAANITTLQGQVQTLQSQIATLQANSGNAAQIQQLQQQETTDQTTLSNLQTAVTSDETAISFLQTAEQSNATNITALQSALAAQMAKEGSDVAGLQSEITSLQGSVGKTAPEQHSNNTLGWVGIGVGAAGLGVGSVALLENYSDSSGDAGSTDSSSATPSTSHSSASYGTPGFSE